jgi:carbonic anhydrase
MGENNLRKPERALHKLVTGNELYINSCRNPAYISYKERMQIALNGQTPYAAILTCADSRVPPEHIFSAGIGDLFVVRTAGNVVGDFELGSIEFAVQQFHVPIIVVMGHTCCAAVEAALEGRASGYIETVAHEIRLGLNGATTKSEAIRNNILHSKQRVLQSKTVSARLGAELTVICAEYDIQTGHVSFFD